MTTPEELKLYREGRLARLLKYYDSRAIWNKRLYFGSAVVVLAGSSVISPVVLLFKTSGQLVVAGLGPLVTFVAAFAALFKFHESWLSYRATWDSLNHEVSCYETRAGSYAECDDPGRFLVERVEALVSREGAEWLQRHTAKKKDDAKRC